VEKKEKLRFRCGNERRENRVLDGRRGRRCYEERETIEHMWNGCSEMRKRKDREEIQNEDRRVDKMHERDMEEEGKDRKRKVLGIVKKMLIFEIVFLCL
jgi:hypothetical protein